MITLFLNLFFRMKKLSVLFLSLALVGILAGCFHNGGATTTTTDDGTSATTTTTTTTEGAVQ